MTHTQPPSPGVSPFTKAMLDGLWPQQSRTFRCRDCGERFRATWRVGCFGPMGVQVERLRFPFSLGRDEVVLCGRCGAAPWASPEQQLLRRAMVELEHRAPGAAFVTEVRHASARQMEDWAAGLDLEAFRRLAPEWFEALWLQGANPEPKQPLPRLQTKKVRLFMRKAQPQKVLAHLPALPEPDPVILGQRQAALDEHARTAEGLAQEVAALGRTVVLAFGSLAGAGLTLPGSTTSGPVLDGCYRLTPEDGPALAGGLRKIPDLADLARLEHTAEQEQILGEVLKRRLTMLLSQAGLA